MQSEPPPLSQKKTERHFSRSPLKLWVVAVLGGAAGAFVGTFGIYFSLSFLGWLYPEAKEFKYMTGYIAMLTLPIGTALGVIIAPLCYLFFSRKR